MSSNQWVYRDGFLMSEGEAKKYDNEVRWSQRRIEARMKQIEAQRYYDDDETQRRMKRYDDIAQSVIDQGCKAGNLYSPLPYNEASLWDDVDKNVAAKKQEAMVRLYRQRNYQNRLPVAHA